MAGLVPKDINVHHVHDVNINLNTNIPVERISNSITNVLWVFCFTSVIRSRFRK